MKYEIHYGKLMYLSFVIVDLICLGCANYAATRIYLQLSTAKYGYASHRPVVVIMLFIDLVVTFSLNTLRGVLRRRKRSEIFLNAVHILASFFILAVVLFSLRQGAQYSRVIVYMAYSIYYVLMCCTHLIWRKVIELVLDRSSKSNRALLMTTDRFAKDGLNELKRTGNDLKYLYLLKNINVDEICGIPVVKNVDELASIICWERIEGVYIYGVEQQMIPDKLIAACRRMDLKINFVDFNYKVIEVKTIQNPDPKYGALSFLEGKRDIPFPIRRVYWITETEADLHRGFHAHKLNCQLLFCPYGVIDILLDNGREKSIVTLDKPGKGLLLMPGLWREMIWKKSGSVLCVLASEYYDASEYIRNYDDFISYHREYGSDILDIIHEDDMYKEMI